MESTHQKRLDPMVHLLSDLHGPLLTKAYDRGNTSHLRLRLVSKLWKSRIDDLFLSEIPIRLHENTLPKDAFPVSTKFLRLQLDMSPTFNEQIGRWMIINKTFISNLRALKITMFRGKSICHCLLSLCVELEELEVWPNFGYPKAHSMDLDHLTQLTSLLVPSQRLDLIPDLTRLKILNCFMPGPEHEGQILPDLPKLEPLTLNSYNSPSDHVFPRRLTELTELILFLEPGYLESQKVTFDLASLVNLKVLKIPSFGSLWEPVLKFGTPLPSLGILDIHARCTFDPIFPIKMFPNLKMLHLNIYETENIGLEYWEPGDVLRIKKVSINTSGNNYKLENIRKNLSSLTNDAHIMVCFI